MSCSRCRRRREIEEQVESTSENTMAENLVESEYDSFHNSRCFLVVWRDRSGRRRCKCCCRN